MPKLGKVVPTKQPKYKSLLEENVARELARLKVKFDYEPMTLKFEQPAKRRRYKPDFVIVHDDQVVVLETKGRLTAADRHKMIWVRDQNPNVKIYFVFQNASNYIRKGSPTTYALWAEANGFGYYDLAEGLKGFATFLKGLAI